MGGSVGVGAVGAFGPGADCEVGRTDSPLAGVVVLELSIAVLLVPLVISVNCADKPPDPYVNCAGRCPWE